MSRVRSGVTASTQLANSASAEANSSPKTSDAEQRQEHGARDRRPAVPPPADQPERATEPGQPAHRRHRPQQAGQEDPPEAAGARRAGHAEDGRGERAQDSDPLGVAQRHHHGQHERETGTGERERVPAVGCTRRTRTHPGGEHAAWSRCPGRASAAPAPASSPTARLPSRRPSRPAGLRSGHRPSVKSSSIGRTSVQAAGRRAGGYGGRLGHRSLLDRGRVALQRDRGRCAAALARGPQREPCAQPGAGLAGHRVDDRDVTAVQVGHPAGDGEPEPGAAAGRGRRAGRTARRPGRGRPAAMPAPWSATSSRQPSGSASADTRTTPPAGLCREALSSRFDSSWCSRARSACTVRSVGYDAHVVRHRRGPASSPRRPRRRSRSATGTSSSASAATPASTRDRSSRSPTSALSRSAWSSAVRIRPGRRGPRRRRGSPARRPAPASGVRSSWETFATRSRRCRSTSARSAAIRLNARASSPTSSVERRRHADGVVALRPSAGRRRSSAAAARSSRPPAAG